MKLSKVLQAGLGIFLILPFEDATTGGLTMAPTAAVGSYLLLDAFGVKLW